MFETTLGTVFLSETIGTAILLLLGCGVVANVALAKSKGAAGGFLLVNFGWGLAVFAGVYAAFKSGAHLNPAVTVGLLANGAETYGPGIPVTVATTLTYFVAQLIGAMLGAVLCWLAYKNQFDASDDKAAMLAVFSTAPEVRSPVWNVVTEAIGTFVLVFIILMFGNTPAELGALPVALLVVGIGASLGGPTGYAINPVRDLGPRIVHAFLPIRGKGPSDWGYSWVPVVGPLIGGALAGLAAAAYV